eukprot:scaffold109070_cov63-Phaeocystis_antarctica.AAC.1
MALGLGAHQPLTLLQRFMPIVAPRRQRRSEHGALHSARRRSQHAHAALPLKVQVQPRLPALGQTRLHHTLCCHLLQVRHALFMRSLRLFGQGLCVLLLLTEDAQAELLFQFLQLRVLCQQRRSHLRSQRINLGLLLNGTAIGFCPHQPLALLQDAPPFLGPVIAPRCQRRRQCRSHQAARSRR